MADGDVIWNVSPNSAETRCYIDVLSDGVLVGWEDGLLQKLDKSDGSIIDSIQLNYAIVEGLATHESEDYTIVPTTSGLEDSTAGNESAEVHKVNLNTFTSEWNTTRSVASDTVPAVDPLDESVYILYNDAYLEAHTTDGNLKWSHDFADDTVGVSSKVAIDSNGRLYMGAGTQIASIKRNGGSAWTYNPSDSLSTESGPIIGGSGDIYISNENGKMYRFSASGSVQASNKVDTAGLKNTAAFSSDGSRLMVGCPDTDLYILDPSDLSVQASNVGSGGHAGCVQADDMGRGIIYSPYEKKVIAYDDASASQVWTTSINVPDYGGGGDPGPSIEDGAVYVPAHSSVVKIENNAKPVTSRGGAFDLPYYHAAHHNFEPSTITRCLLMSDGVALRGGRRSSGQQAVVYDDGVARIEKHESAGGSVVLSAEDLGQS